MLWRVWCSVRTGARHALCVLSRFSHVWLFATLWTTARQAPLSRGFSRQEHWSGLPCLPLGIFPTQGWDPRLSHPLRWQTGSLPLVPRGRPMGFISILILNIAPWGADPLSPHYRQQIQGSERAMVKHPGREEQDSSCLVQLPPHASYLPTCCLCCVSPHLK